MTTSTDTQNPIQTPADAEIHRLSHPDETVSTEDKLTFEDLGLAKPILEALTKAGYTHPTPIQAGAIPPSLAGRDLLLSAQTGSGKTAAFVLPILHRLANTAKLTNRHTKKQVKAVILTPTRELALQVQDSVRTYASRLQGVFSVPLVGGADYRGQIRALTKGVQIIVATPGRFIDHMQSGRIDLSELDVLVLDEADRMLDMGFSEDIDTILNATPESRQTIMSSATWDGAVGKIAESFTTDPERISIKVESAHIDESVYFCDDFSHKNNILYRLLDAGEISQAVIFTATKMSTEHLADDLCQRGYTARYLHGDLPQGKRNRIVSDVKAGKCQFLIATDVAARGIDIATISHVINYDLPRQAEDYVHRIGRSGRAGRTGQAISLCSMDDRNLLFAINRYLNRKMRIETLDGLEPKRDFNERPKAPKKGKGKGKGRSDRRGGRFEKSERSFDKKPNQGRFDRSFDKPFKDRQDKDRQDKDRQDGGEREFKKSYTDKPRFKKDGFKKDNFQKGSFQKDNHKDNARKSRFNDDRYANAKVFDDSPNAFKKDGFDKKEKFGKSDKSFGAFDKKERAEKSDKPFNKFDKFDKSSKKDKPKSNRFDDRQKSDKPKKKRDIEEFVFNQTAPKRRFGDKD